MSKERPILVSGPLIGPILRGEKTVTRRLAPIRLDTSQKWGPYDCWTFYKGKRPFIGFSESNRGQDLCIPHCPYGRGGDVLWVRETWALWRTDTLGEFGSGDEVLDTPWEGRVPLDRQPTETAVLYRERDADEPDECPWRPSIHMPRWAARIFLRVEDVRVERVQDITEEDAIAEGCDWAAPHWPNPKDVPERDEPNDGPAPSRGERGFARDNFARLWDSLAPAGSKWADNPWVWRIAFKLEAPNVR